MHHEAHEDVDPSHPGRDIERVDGSMILTTVGVDIGSSTTHFAVSRLRLTLQGARYVPDGATLLQQSEVLLTPYSDDEFIDIERLSDFISSQYVEAGISREDVDTGAVLLTGLAAARLNARRVGDIFADAVGRFVAVSAGHHLEAELSTRGSGALALSRQLDANVLHIDIGGGTTKFAYCRRGRIHSTAAIGVGARLVVWDEDGIVTRVEHGAKDSLNAAGVNLAVGDRIRQEQTDAFCGYLAGLILDVIRNQAPTTKLAGLLLTDGLRIDNDVDTITFSGGVSEYIYGRETRDFGDLGRGLADALREQVATANIEVVEPAAGIRATVMGASQFTVRVSSQTIFVDPLAALPVRNVPVVVPHLLLEEPNFTRAHVHDALTLALRQRDLDIPDSQRHIAIAIRWIGSASHARLDALSHGIITAVTPLLAGDECPLILVADTDIGRLLGLHLRENQLTDRPIVSIDGIELRNFDFVDIGEVAQVGVTPVVVKSLVFPT